MTIEPRSDESVDEAMRRIAVEQVDSRRPALEWSAVRGFQIEPRRGRHRTLLGVTVAACVVGVIVGLAWVSARGSDLVDSVPAAVSSAEPSTAGMALADVEALAADVFVVPLETPGSIEFQFAMRSRGPEEGSTTRSVRAGNERNPEALVVHVDLGGGPPAVAEPIQIDRRQWMVSEGPGGWSAFTDVGDSTVAVYGAGRFFEPQQSILEQLVVIPERLLPHPPLDLSAPMTEVAWSDVGGQRVALDVQISNGYLCSRTESSSGSSGGCGTRLVDRETSVFADGVSGGSYEWADGADTIAALASGVVHDDVAIVEVEFMDGTVVSATPVDDSGLFDGFRFWVVGADVRVDPARGAAGFVAVSEVRAFGADGELLETASPPG